MCRYFSFIQLPMPVNESPEKPIHDLAPIRLARVRLPEITHLEQIVAPA